MARIIPCIWSLLRFFTPADYIKYELYATFTKNDVTNCIFALQSGIILLMKFIQILFLIIFSANCTLAAIVDCVPIDSKLYKNISILIDKKIITDYKTDFSGKVEISRYDFADALIEPSERCISVSMTQLGNELTPTQRRRSELFTNALSILKPAEVNSVIDALSSLNIELANDIEQLSPGLPARLTDALRTIKADRTGFWQKIKNVSKFIADNVHLTIGSSTNDKLSPIHFSPADLSPGPTTMAMTSSSHDGQPISFSVKTATSLEASLDIAINRALLYGSLSSIPSKNPIDTIIPDGTGKAMVGVKYDLGKINNFDIVGIFEFHIMRTGESGNRELKTGAVGGIGLKW
jgi:hypothetical protein